MSAGPPLHEALRAAVAAPGEPPPELRETHGAWVVLTRDRAYKLKKPVRFAFLDYSTPAARRAACEAELRVNRELAGEIMLGLRGLRPADGGVELCDPDAPDAVDWLVEMRRFDERRTMAALADRGELTAELVRAAAARIAAFHAEAEVVADPGAAERARTTIARNLAELREVAGAGEARELLGRLDALLLGVARGRLADLDARGRAGRVRDGHGDLRTDHIVFEGGRVLVVDRLEFSPSLRRVDVADDLSFLAMDLEARGAPQAARLLVDAYREAGGDPGDAGLVALFGAHRALVRAKVALLRARQDPAGGAAADAARLIALAARLAWRAAGPLVLVVGGPPASGKSTLAGALAARSGLPVLSSDAVRKERLGLAAATPAPSAAYAPAGRAAVYAELGRRARAALDDAAGVIVDATFGEPPLRAALLGALTPAQRGRVRAVVCRAPLEVLLARAAIPERAASDAGPDVAERLARGFAPVTELEPARVLGIDGTAPPAQQLAAIEAWLDPTAAPGGR